MRKQLLLSSSILIALLTITGFIVVTTTPDSIGPVGVTVFFVLLFLIIYTILDFLWRQLNHKKKDKVYSVYQIAIYAGIPTVLLALQSLGQLQLRDVGVVVLLSIILLFYMSRSSKK